jgi:hypothetical protein
LFVAAKEEKAELYLNREQTKETTQVRYIYLKMKKNTHTFYVCLHTCMYVGIEEDEWIE